MPGRGAARLPRWQFWLLILSGAALWLSGGLWLLLHYFGQREGDFGPEANPLEIWMIRLHGLALIPALLGVGGLFVAHIPKGWPYKSQRIPGITLGALLGLLVVSGYMLYYVSLDDVRTWTSIAHWSIGLGLPAIFTWHYVIGVLTRGASAAARQRKGRK